MDGLVKQCEKMGQIVKIINGDDGVVRSVNMKDVYGELKRPVKLALVFYDGNSEINERSGTVGAFTEHN